MMINKGQLSTLNSKHVLLLMGKINVMKCNVN